MSGLNSKNPYERLIYALEWLDRQGGLGPDKHEVIRNVLEYSKNHGNDYRQRIADYFFSVAIAAAGEMHGAEREEIAEWISNILRDQLDIYTFPMGSSWGAVVSKDTYEKMRASNLRPFEPNIIEGTPYLQDRANGVEGNWCIAILKTGTTSYWSNGKWGAYTSSTWTNRFEAKEQLDKVLVEMGLKSIPTNVYLFREALLNADVVKMFLSMKDAVDFATHPSTLAKGPIERYSFVKTIHPPGKSALDNPRIPSMVTDCVLVDMRKTEGDPVDVDYYVVEAPDGKVLRSTIKHMIRDGWELVGGVACSAYHDPDLQGEDRVQVTYMQAMVREVRHDGSQSS